MTYGYFTADISTGVNMRSLYPAFAGLRFRRSPERTFVSSGGRLRRFGAAQSPPPNRRVPIQPAYSAEHGKQNSTNKSNS